MRFHVMTALATLQCDAATFGARQAEIDSMRAASPDSFGMLQIDDDGARRVIVAPKSAPPGWHDAIGGGVVSPIVVAAYQIKASEPVPLTSIPTPPPPAPSRAVVDSAVVLSAASRPGMVRTLARAERMPLLGDAARAGRDRVRAERRVDLQLDSAHIGASLRIGTDDKGRKRLVIADGFALSERAIRGLLGRIESDALGYVLGLRDRIETERAKPAASQNVSAMDANRAEIVRVIARECNVLESKPCKVRAREATRDVFAVLSPGYSNADADASIDELLSCDLLGAPGVRGDFRYDPGSTAWRLRAQLTNPSPVEEQHVGEPFSVYVDVSGRDNGTGRWIAGGGTEIWSCSNGAVRCVDGVRMRRIHRGNVLRDVDVAIRAAMSASSELIEAWGRNRTIEAEMPSKVTIEDAIPGFYRAMLRDDRDLVKVPFRGQREEIVKGLSAAYFGERRDSERVVRADLAQGWTKYVQRHPLDVRSEAEAAIGSWLARATETHKPTVPYRAA